MEVSSLRAEIKAWENEFRATRGRDPSVQEIKDRPDIAEKYKLYKKLSKQSNASSSASTSARPPLPEDRRRTPPRDPHRPSSSSLLLSTSKHRAVRTEASTSTSNPFSPVKQRGKDRYNHNDPDSADDATDINPLLLASSSRKQTNPFATPSKPRARPSSSRKIPPPVLEEDPFPLIDSHTLASSSKARLPQQTQLLDESNAKHIDSDNQPSRPDQPNAKPVEDAVTRARKRLRGEPVSPSPVKEKRARTGVERVNSSSLGRGSLFDTLQAAKDEDSDEEYVKRVSEDEFIGETPVKPMKGGKAFVKLFDEVIPAPAFQQSRAKPSKSSAKAKSAGPSLLAFGFGSQGQSRSNGKQRALSHSNMEEDDMDIDFDASGAIKAVGKSAKSMQKNGGLPTKAVLPGKSDLFDDNSSTSSVAERVGKLAIKKRSAAVTEGDIEDGSGELTSSQSSPRALPLLLPPSPPPVSSSNSKYTGDKGKASAKGAARKKTKLLEQLIAADDSDGGEADGMSGEDEVKVKEVSWSWNNHLRRKRHDTVEGIPGVDEDGLAGSEPELDMTMYRPAEVSSAEEEEEKFEVNLPEHLRTILAISPRKPHAPRDDEEKVARGLIYGRREGHYDPTRGGEIWGVGEVSEEDGEREFGIGERKAQRPKDAEEDDDWEGEPVPWEVGEL